MLIIGCSGNKNRNYDRNEEAILSLVPEGEEPIPFEKLSEFYVSFVQCTVPILLHCNLKKSEVLLQEFGIRHNHSFKPIVFKLDPSLASYLADSVRIPFYPLDKDPDEEIQIYDGIWIQATYILEDKKVVESVSSCKLTERNGRFLIRLIESAIEHQPDTLSREQLGRLKYCILSDMSRGW